MVDGSNGKIAESTAARASFGAVRVVRVRAEERLRSAPTTGVRNR
jgi:hypothetical protein